MGSCCSIDMDRVSGVQYDSVFMSEDSCLRVTQGILVEAKGCQRTYFPLFPHPKLFISLRFTHNSFHRCQASVSFIYQLSCFKKPKSPNIKHFFKYSDVHWRPHIRPLPPNDDDNPNNSHHHRSQQGPRKWTLPLTWQQLLRRLIWHYVSSVHTLWHSNCLSILNK